MIKGQMKNMQDYKKWIISHKNFVDSIEENDDTLRLSTKLAIGTIRFHIMKFTVVVEMSINDVANNENKFYLHFKLKDLNHAKDLFNDMLDALCNMKNQIRQKILLCCSGGLSTAYFAEKLNEAANLMSLNYEFNALPISYLDKIKDEYSMILLAPQINYKYQKISDMFPNKKILKIPTKSFASYDVNAVLEFVRTNEDISASKVYSHFINFRRFSSAIQR